MESCLWYGLLCLLTVLAGLSESKGALSEDQTVAVQNVFKHILKLQPPNDGNVLHNVVKPPKHMMELYEKFTKSGGFKKTTGNTVRSILPTTIKGSSPTSSLLVFNVTCIEQTEEVNLAQLHLHRRRLPRHERHDARNSRFLAPPYRVRLFQIHSHRSRPTPLASLPVPQHIRGGWHSLDITPVLRELLLSHTVTSLQLGVRFEAPRNQPISHEHFLKTTNETSAFLVVFSEDVANNGLLSEETRALNPVRHTHELAKLIQKSTGFRTFESLSKRVLHTLHEETPSYNRTSDDFYLETGNEGGRNFNDDDSEKVEENNFGNSKKGLKKTMHLSKPKNTISKSDDNNDESENEVGGNDEPDSRKVKKNTLLRSSKFDSKGSSRPNRRRRIHPKTRYRIRPRPEDSESSGNDVAKRVIRSTPPRVLRSIIDNELPDSVAPSGEILKTSPQTLLKSRGSKDAPRRSSSNVIPLPRPENKRWGGRAGGRRRKGRGKKRNNRKKGKKGTTNWQESSEQSSEDWHENSARADHDENGSCRKNKLVVDFVDIGWADWIISPPKFEAHYCSGKCVYPLTKAMKPTNHATIQSLVHALGQQDEVPDPCCVPDKLSAMSLLYLDDNNNVVLRSYHDMIVETCACR